MAWLKAVVLYWGPNIQLVLRINRSGLLRLGTRFVSVEEAQAQRRKSSKGLRTEKGDDMENRAARGQHEWKVVGGRFAAPVVDWYLRGDCHHGHTSSKPSHANMNP